MDLIDEINKLQSEMETSSIQGDLRLAIKYVFESIDKYLVSGNFNDVSKILDSIIIENLDPKVIVSFLSVTNPYKEEVNLKKSRDNFLNKCEERLITNLGKERSMNILYGLR